MSRFGDDNTEAHDAEDLCPTCHNDVGNCACPDPEICAFCGRLLPDHTYFPYCNTECGVRAEQFDHADCNLRRA